MDWILTGFLWGSGQVCSATSRVLVERSVYDKVVEKVLARVAAVQVVDTQKPAPEGGHMGPVISRGQYDKIWAFIDEARAQAKAQKAAREAAEREVEELQVHPIARRVGF